MAVLREAMGLLALPGLPVPSLGFPVNLEFPLPAALVRTIGLAAPAPPAHEETGPAPSATNLDKKQNGLRPCKQSEAVIDVWCMWGFRSFRSFFSKPEVAASGFPFLSLQMFGEINKKALLAEGPGGQNGERFYWWVISVSTGGSFFVSKGSEAGAAGWVRNVSTFTGGSFFVSKVGHFR